MLTEIHSRKKTQLIMALFIGIVFGFLLQKGEAASYAVVMEQLLLRDFTVVKIMLSAVIVGMAGIYSLRAGNHIRLHPKQGSLGSVVPGGIIFGAGFALLGYCPGTLAAAAGQGSLDALLAGIPGMIAGAWIYAVLYPKLNARVLGFGNIGSVSIPSCLKIHEALAVPLIMLILTGILLLIEFA